MAHEQLLAEVLMPRASIRLALVPSPGQRAIFVQGIDELGRSITVGADTKLTQGADFYCPIAKV